MGSCTSSKGTPKLKIYIEHSTDQNCLDAYKVAHSAISQQLKVSVSQQLKANQSNLFSVIVINPGQDRSQVWNTQSGDELINEQNVFQLIEKIKQLSQK